jgi:hypothetical protein
MHMEVYVAEAASCNATLIHPLQIQCTLNSFAANAMHILVMPTITSPPLRRPVQRTLA